MTRLEAPMASDEGKHAVNDVGACEEWCAACRKARKQADER